MAVRNAFYAQSGGLTAIINATACGLIQEARRHPERIGKVLAGRDGIIGALTEDLIDQPGHPTRDALDRVLKFLADRLLPATDEGSAEEGSAR